MSLPAPESLPLGVEVAGTIEHVDGAGSFWFRPKIRDQWLQTLSDELRKVPLEYFYFSPSVRY